MRACSLALVGLNVQLQDPSIQLVWPQLRLKIGDRLIKEFVAGHSCVSFALLAATFTDDVSQRVLALIESGDLADFRVDLEHGNIVHSLSEPPSALATVAATEAAIFWTRMRRVLALRFPSAAAPGGRRNFMRGSGPIELDDSDRDYFNTSD